MVIETSAQLGECHLVEKKKLQSEYRKDAMGNCNKRTDKSFVYKRCWWSTVYGRFRRLLLLLLLFLSQHCTVCKLGIIASKYSLFSLWQLNEWIFRYLWMYNNRPRQWRRRMNFHWWNLLPAIVVVYRLSNILYSCIEHCTASTCLKWIFDARHVLSIN